MWIVLFFMLILISPIVQLANYWYVFHIWPVSWTAFFVMAVIGYIYAELVKKSLKKVWEDYK